MAEDCIRATLIRNPEYERDGLKSYVRALQKCKRRVNCPPVRTALIIITDKITPTVPGPYCLANQIIQPTPQVELTHFGDTAPGRIVAESHVLVKKDAETGHAGQVPACL